MSTQHKSFAFAPHEPARLQLSWETAAFSTAIRNTEVRVDGQIVARIPTKQELLAGQTFSLPDGSRLFVQFSQTRGAVGWNIRHNERPVVGSAADPVAKIKKAIQAVYAVAGLNLVLGLISVLVTLAASRPGSMAMGVGSLLYGAVFLALGFAVQRRSRGALGLAIALQCFDIITTVVFTLPYGVGMPLIAGFVVKTALLVHMLNGFRALAEAKQLEQPNLALPSKAR